MMDGQCASPTLYPTAAPAFLFDETDVESIDRVSSDHLQAARTATLRQHCMEQNAALNDMSVEDYMRLTDSMPVTDYKKRPTLDPIDDDYMQAARIATEALNSLEAEAAAAELTVDEYMTAKGMLTDSHLAPWAR